MTAGIIRGEAETMAKGGVVRPKARVSLHVRLHHCVQPGPETRECERRSVPVPRTHEHGGGDGAREEEAAASVNWMGGEAAQDKDVPFLCALVVAHLAGGGGGLFLICSTVVERGYGRRA